MFVNHLIAISIKLFLEKELLHAKRVIPVNAAVSMMWEVLIQYDVHHLQCIPACMISTNMI